MNLIDSQIQKIKSEKKIGLMAHAVAGYPSLGESERIILALADNGADFLEIQIPFSDPMGDGDIIRIANTKAIKNGFRVKQAFELIKKIKTKTNLPILIMTYLNIAYHYGLEKFCEAAQNAGASGLIIPDYPESAEQYDHLAKIAKNNNLFLIKFLSLDSSCEKLKQVSQNAEGFVYCFSRRSVTGAQADILAELENFLKKAKKYISLPLAVGFGISEAKHIKALKNEADIAIVGSALIKTYNKNRIGGVIQKIKELKNA